LAYTLRERTAQALQLFIHIITITQNRLLRLHGTVRLKLSTELETLLLEQ